MLDPTRQFAPCPDFSPTRGRTSSSFRFHSNIEVLCITESQFSQGHKIFESKDCLSCHSTDGADIVGPTLLEIYGRPSTLLDYPGEGTITVDGEYFWNSILEPSSEVVKGCDNVMPKFPISDDKIKEIIAFFKTLKQPPVCARSYASPGENAS